MACWVLNLLSRRPNSLYVARRYNRHGFYRVATGVAFRPTMSHHTQSRSRSHENIKTSSTSFCAPTRFTATSPHPALVCPHKYPRRNKRACFNNEFELIETIFTVDLGADVHGVLSH
jgi:hypothetical protein